MSAGEQGETKDRLIVMHPPMTGDPKEVEGFWRARAESLEEQLRATKNPSATGSTNGAQKAAPKKRSKKGTQPGAAPEIEVTQGEPAAAPAPTPAGTERAFGLDTLRGILILLMNLSFAIPARIGLLPNWMFHQQYPAPGETLANIPGLTWVDMVFPGFVFSMAAAIPVANSQRLANGMSWPAVLIGALKRGFLLFVFAFIIGHVNPFWTHDTTKRGNIIAIIGFLLCFAIFVRRRPDWNPKIFKWVRIAGWTGVLAYFLVVYPILYHEHFSPVRNDDIIVSIAFASVAGTIIWLFTQNNWTARTIIMALVVAARTGGQNSEGWLHDFWRATPASWLYGSWFLELLLIVIPGLIAGDLLVRWLRAPRSEPAQTDAPGWPPVRLLAIALAPLVIFPVLMVGLYNEQYVPQMTVIVLGVVVAGLFLVARPASERERLIATFYRWSAFLLTVGLLLEPAEGGIKKDPQTLAYLMLAAGVSMGTLMALTVLIDARKQGKKLVKPLIAVGQNPLMGYITYMLLLSHLMYLFDLGDVLTGNWAAALVKCLIVVSAVTLFVWFATKHRIFWRT